MSFKIHEKIDHDLDVLIQFHEDEKKEANASWTRTTGIIQGLRDAQKVVFKRFKEAGVI